MNEKLKPCPFCGGEAKVKVTKKDYIGFTIWCACKCGARTEGFCPDTNKEDDTMENIEECKKRAIETWNRRANDEID
jgi:Lar family restriction alleviation protein